MTDVFNLPENYYNILNNMDFPILYKLDSKVNIRQWRIFTNPIFGNNNGKWEYVQEYGLKNGKLQQTSVVISSGKNIGKSNETTTEQQCELEARSLWNKKQEREGYTTYIPISKPLMPMLAHDYKKPNYSKKIKFPCFAQPKLNGYRCLAIVTPPRSANNVKLISRKNLEWKALGHLNKELSVFPKGIYDGELYKHGPDFQEICGAVSRDEPNDLSAKIEYHIYDLVDENLPFSERHKLIQDIITKHGIEFVKPVSTVLIKSSTLIDQAHDDFVSQGYEGIILRNSNGLYKINGRSSDLQKFKKFEDDEFKIIGANEMGGNWIGCCTFRCKTKAGHIFDVTPEGDYSTRSKYWQDWNSGKIKPGDLLTVKYFGYTTTNNPVPYLPVGICIRNNE